MQKLRNFLLVLGTTMLVAISTRGHAQAVDCRSCHAPNGAAGATDFSHIYASPTTHHSVGRNYPAGLNATPNFNQPNGQSAGLTFFDRNGNGQPDDDEIQLFSEGGTATVECASCHAPHGTEPAPANTTGNLHLRGGNKGSALCITCHSY
ncbi:hypothetical protein RHDC2_00059 [Rhodocyclaceae bacterium]|nr:hypothetical protein RHDC2_00059 [Rhodocyclaceae bacterium]